MMLGEWGKRGTTDFPGHGASVRMFFLCRKDRLETQGFLLPVQQGGDAFFPVFRNGFQGGPGNQEGAFHAQFFSLFIPELAQARQIGLKLVGMLAALDAATAQVLAAMRDWLIARQSRPSAED